MKKDKWDFEEILLGIVVIPLFLPICLLSQFCQDEFYNRPKPIVYQLGVPLTILYDVTIIYLLSLIK
jgi:hypothetical protein